MSNFILGAAQLGMPYGIANIHGQPSLADAKEIVSLSLDANISCFDTAQGYGTSEQVIGQCLQALNIQDTVKIITKVAFESLQDKKSLEQAFNISLQNLNIKALYCFMLHHEKCLSYLDAWQGVYLQEQQKQGYIENIGISVYSPELALRALEHPAIQIVQVPSSLFDKRFIKAGIFEKAQKNGKEVHIRSVFLQGVLCMMPESLPSCLAPLAFAVRQFHDLCTRYGCTPSQAALFWMRNKEPKALLIFGAESSTQVQENMNTLWQEKCNTQDFLYELDKIYIPQEPKILNPALWKI